MPYRSICLFVRYSDILTLILQKMNFTLKNSMLQKLDLAELNASLDAQTFSAIVAVPDGGQRGSCNREGNAKNGFWANQSFQKSSYVAKNWPQPSIIRVKRRR